MEKKVYRLSAGKMIYEAVQNRKMIRKLAKNDFVTKYAGSYLGILWAFVQPVITILLYWFVFQVGFSTRDVGDYPFVLWLSAGMIPWFFFSDAWGNNSSYSRNADREVVVHSNAGI